VLEAYRAFIDILRPPLIFLPLILRPPLRVQCGNDRPACPELLKRYARKQVRVPSASAAWVRQMATAGTRGAGLASPHLAGDNSLGQSRGRIASLDYAVLATGGWFRGEPASFLARAILARNAACQADKRRVTIGAFFARTRTLIHEYLRVLIRSLLRTDARICILFLSAARVQCCSFETM